MSTGSGPASTRLLIATHNIMHGLRLRELCRRYGRLQQGPQPLDPGGWGGPLGVLCIQEDQRTPRGTHAEEIARVLGPAYECRCAPEAPGLALVFDARRLRAARVFTIPLPRLGRLSALERLYIAGGRTQQKHCLVGAFEPQGGGPFVVANFHLDTAGGNAHRRGQVQALAGALAGGSLTRRLAACGDTNAFALRRQPVMLQRLLGPLQALGAEDPGSLPTHYFSRQDEPRLTHQLCVLLGKLGLDLPRRYDVICTNLPVARRGQIETPESDHDLVYCEVDLG